MNHWQTPPRYEVKVALEGRALADVLAWVRLHPAHWQVAYPDRQVNNVYFDTADYQGLNANLSGIADRVKLRLRWYGPTLHEIQSASLEFKHKQGMIGYKEICNVGETVDLSVTPWADVLHTLDAAINPHGQRWLRSVPHPVLINTYRRAYYVTPDQRVRLTVDSDLRAYDQRFSAYPNLVTAASLPSYVVLELKAGRAYYQHLADALAHFPVRVDRFSKYVQGMLAAPDF